VTFNPGIQRRLKLLTYNIHSGIGTDRRYDLGRIRRILEEERPEIAALQELDCRVRRSGGDDQSSKLATVLMVTSTFCATLAHEEGSSGLAVLSRFRVLHRQEYNLSYLHREPRYCLRVDLEVEPGAVLHVFNCHLGLATRERSFQRKQMLSEAILLSKELHHPVILMGDFNDRPIPVVHRSLRSHFQDAYQAAGKFWGPTFKAGPIPLRLDHVYVSSGIRVLDCVVRNDRLARTASDHKPLIATVEVTWP